MDITMPPAVADLASRTREFIAAVVIPVEEETGGSIHAAPDELRRSLQKQAAEAGLLAPQGTLSSFDPLMLVNKETRIIGTWYGSARPAHDFPWILDQYRQGRINLDALATQTLPLAVYSLFDANLDRVVHYRIELSGDGSERNEE